MNIAHSKKKYVQVADTSVWVVEEDLEAWLKSWKMVKNA